MDRNKLKQLLFLTWNNGRDQYHPAKGGAQQRYDYLEFISSMEYKINELCESQKPLETKATLCQDIRDRFSSFVKAQKDIDPESVFIF